MAADNKVTLEIAAIDAFSGVFQTAQSELQDLQKSARAAFNAAPSAIQREIADLQGQFNKASQNMADTSKNSSTAMATGIQNTTKTVSGLNDELRNMGQYVIGAFSLTAIFGFLKESMNASMQMDAINSKLKVLTGSAKGAATEWQFIEAEAKRLGLDLQQTADAYASFAVATKNTSMEGEAARKMFVGVSEAATALHLPADMTTRVLYQFQQMLSKGKVNMEDLKTASESFPGLLKQVADSLGITTAALLDQMQKGELMSAEVLPKLGEQLHKTYGTAATEAATKGRAAINSMTTEIFKMKQQIGEDTGPGILAIGRALLNIAKAVVGGWMLIAVQVGYTWDVIKTKMDLALSPEETKRKLQILSQAYTEQVSEITRKYGESKTVIAAAEQATTAEIARNNQRRRDEAKKTGADLAKLNLDYFKTTGDLDAELTATAEQEYQKRIAAAKAYYDQKKAAAKSDSEEVAWEKLKTAKLAEIARQHSQEYQIIHAQMISKSVDIRKAGLGEEIAAIKLQAAEQIITEEEASQRITALSIAAANDQYQARLYVATKIGQIYGKDSEEYRKALAAQQSSHQEFLSARTEAYKKYSDQIKALEKSIADYRLGIQSRIRDLQQKGMTDEQKYADNLKRYNEAIDQAESLRRQKKYDEATKYNSRAEELAGRLADTQVQGVNGVEAATKALQRVEENGVKIMEDKKQEAEENLKKLKEIADVTLDPKKLEVNLEEAALNRVKAELEELTKPATKSIYIETIGPSSDSQYTNYQGMATGGQVGGAGIGDTQLRLLDPREWVIRPEATSFWGSSFMAAINNPFSSAGRNIMDRISGFNLPSVPLPSPSFGMAAGGPVGAGTVDMGSITINVGGSDYPVMGRVDVLSELKTALRREALVRKQ